MLISWLISFFSTWSDGQICLTDIDHRLSDLLLVLESELQAFGVVGEESVEFVHPGEHVVLGEDEAL